MVQPSLISPNHINVTKPRLEEQTSLLPKCKMNINIHYCYLTQRICPRWRQHDKGIPKKKQCYLETGTKVYEPQRKGEVKQQWVAYTVYKYEIDKLQWHNLYMCIGSQSIPNDSIINRIVSSKHFWKLSCINVIFYYWVIQHNSTNSNQPARSWLFYGMWAKFHPPFGINVRWLETDIQHKYFKNI